MSTSRAMAQAKAAISRAIATAILVSVFTSRICILVEEGELINGSAPSANAPPKADRVLRLAGRARQNWVLDEVGQGVLRSEISTVTKLATDPVIWSPVTTRRPDDGTVSQTSLPTTVPWT